MDGKIEGVMNKGVGIVERVLPSMVGGVAGYGFGELLMQKVNIVDAVLFAMPKTIMGDSESRQDIKDLLVFGIGLGLLAVAIGSFVKGFKGGDMFDKGVSSATGGLALRLGLAFLGNVERA